MVSVPKAEKKVLVVLGTRPEAIKLFPVIHALRARPSVQVRVCTTGQHARLAADVLAMAQIKADVDLALLQPGQSLDTLLARALPAVTDVLLADRPDWVVIQGDTLSAFAGGLAAHFQSIRLAHVEAGLRSGNLRAPAPEEAIRKMLAAIADVHFAPTARAAAALHAENIAAQRVYVTGNSGIDALMSIRERLKAAPHLAAPVTGVLDAVVGKQIIAVTLHRRENHGAVLEGIATALTQLAARPDVAVVYPLHPNPAIRRVMHPRLANLANIALLEPLDYPSFVALLDHARLLLTDSGGIQEEAAALGKPVLVLRNHTERPEGPAAGTALLVGTQPACILAAANRLLDDAGHYARMAQVHHPYGDGKAAARIAKILANAP